MLCGCNEAETHLRLEIHCEESRLRNVYLIR